jgi:hypothetical protein
VGTVELNLPLLAVNANGPIHVSRSITRGDVARLKA